MFVVRMWWRMDSFSTSDFLQIFGIYFGGDKVRFARGANAHLSDDETVAKMGHPISCSI
jgi:hypothetical protein